MPNTEPGCVADVEKPSARFMRSQVVAVVLPDGDVKVVKNKYGYQGVTYTRVLFDDMVCGLQARNPGLNVTVWMLDYKEATRALRGLVSL